MYLYKEILKEYLLSLGVRPGSRVLVQAELPASLQLIGGAANLLGCLQDIVGEEGLIAAPAFSFSTLDPACQNYEYESWPEIRKNTAGFVRGTTPPDSFRDFGVQMLLAGAVRTAHPVYSFLFLGKYRDEWLEQPLNEPISFKHVLAFFAGEENKGINLLICVEKEHSLLLQAAGLEKQMGRAAIKRAAVKKKNKNIAKTFLINILDDTEIEKIQKDCIILSQTWNQEVLTSISLKTSRPSRPATLEMLLKQGESKLFS